MKEKILIIGYGRFGKLLAEILLEDFDVYVWNRSDKSKEIEAAGCTAINIEAGISTCDTIFYAVPISQLETTIRDHLQFLKNSGSKLVVDVLSVKVHAKKVFETYLPANCRAILTHPIFGPDSVRAKGLAGHIMMMDPCTSQTEEFERWKLYWQKKGLRVLEMTADEHDRQAANSQGVVFFLGRLLEEFHFEPTAVDTYWARQLFEIVTNVTNDSWQLFVDLQHYNPYTKKMRAKLDTSLHTVDKKLQINQSDNAPIRFGIQGGKGSFNEAALLKYVHENNITNYETTYLYTSPKVLTALDSGEVDYGIFAVHNSVGGVVDESMHAMADFTFSITAEVPLLIRHMLMKKPEIALSEITQILTHPQVIKQCKQSLPLRLPQFKIASGEGDLIDHAEVARQLAQGLLDPTTAVIGPEILADIYGLEIVEKDFQDSSNNITTFFVVERNGA